MTLARPVRRSRFSPTYDPRGRRRAPPKGDMNVTPFIDVLLVLLVMLILAVPMRVHETSVDLPQDSPQPVAPVLAENTVHITADDRLQWNGIDVSPEQLRAQVAAASSADSEPLLRFEPDASASYDRSARTIALIKESGAKTFAFVGNARHRDFGS